MDALTPYIVGLFGTVGWAQLFCGLVFLCTATSALKQLEPNDGAASSSKGAGGGAPGRTCR